MLPHIPAKPKNTPYIPLAKDGYLYSVVCACVLFIDCQQIDNEKGVKSMLNSTSLHGRCCRNKLFSSKQYKNVVNTMYNCSKYHVQL